MNGKFVPEDWILTDKLRAYAKSKGLTDKQIADQEEGFRLCQFPRTILCWDRAWMRWIRNAIEWGKVVPCTTREYRKPAEVSEEQLQKDREDWARDMRKLRGAK